MSDPSFLQFLCTIYNHLSCPRPGHLHFPKIVKNITKVKLSATPVLAWRDNITKATHKHTNSPTHATKKKTSQCIDCRVTEDRTLVTSFHSVKLFLLGRKSFQVGFQISRFSIIFFGLKVFLGWCVSFFFQVAQFVLWRPSVCSRARNMIVHMQM